MNNDNPATLELTRDPWPIVAIDCDPKSRRDRELSVLAWYLACEQCGILPPMPYWKDPEKYPLEPMRFVNT